jgi:hypothetical protein
VAGKWSGGHVARGPHMAIFERFRLMHALSCKPENLRGIEVDLSTSRRGPADLSRSRFRTLVDGRYVFLHRDVRLLAHFIRPLTRLSLALTALTGRKQRIRASR